MNENQNMRIWNKVCKTDPSHTKQVSFGRRFTAIDAMYQIQSATEVWGPAGEGWGFEGKHSTQECGQVVLAVSDVTLWWRNGDRVNVSGTVRASSTLVSAKGHVDEDAWKKATTDALTKLLSYHGFNADVFLGKFDDNRYVQARAREEAQEKKAATAPAQETGPKISEAQHRRLEARISELRLDRGRVKRWVHAKWGVEHFPELTKAQYQELDEKLPVFAEKVGLQYQMPKENGIDQDIPLEGIGK